ncbi:hypothetical protein QJS66_07385 [Kocuria rhizophila]|nr:hypothetical protein QJS66_07385 [Kocuria rhizophila]
MTAGNSTPLTDGASAVLITSEAVGREHSLTRSPRSVHSEAAAVDLSPATRPADGPRLGRRPAPARPPRVDPAGPGPRGSTEAFASTVLSIMKAWESPVLLQGAPGPARPAGRSTAPS